MFNLPVPKVFGNKRVYLIQSTTPVGPLLQKMQHTIYADRSVFVWVCFWVFWCVVVQLFVFVLIGVCSCSQRSAALVRENDCERRHGPSRVRSSDIFCVVFVTHVCLCLLLGLMFAVLFAVAMCRFRATSSCSASPCCPRSVPFPSCRFQCPVSSLSCACNCAGGRADHPLPALVQTVLPGLGLQPGHARLVNGVETVTDIDAPALLCCDF